MPIPYVMGIHSLNTHNIMKRGFPTGALVLAFTIFILSLSSCKKDSKTENHDPVFVSAMSNPDNIKISDGLANNSDSHAQQAYAHADNLKQQLSAFSAYMSVPSDASYSAGKTGTIGTWTWSGFGYSYEYVLNEDADQYEFTYTIKYQNSPYYVISGWELKNGTQGHLDYDLTDSGGDSFSIDWTKDASDTYVINMKFYELSAPNSPYLRWEGTYHDDGSGNIVISDDGVRYYDATWNVNGSGMSTSYDSDGTTVLDSYNW